MGFDYTLLSHLGRCREARERRHVLSILIRFIWDISWFDGDVLRNGKYGDEGRVGVGLMRWLLRGWREGCAIEALVAMWIEDDLLLREKSIRLVQWLDRCHGYKGE